MKAGWGYLLVCVCRGWGGGFVPGCEWGLQEGGMDKTDSPLFLLSATGE